MSEQEDLTLYKVVVNHEEQYSIWPAEKENALGWHDAGFRGIKSEVLAYIKEHWTDMRPRSLRLQMDSILQPASSLPDTVSNNASISDNANEPGIVATNIISDTTVMTPSTASPLPSFAPSASAKPKHRWFKKRNADSGNSNTNNMPVGVASIAGGAPNEAQQKRGWFGRRHAD